MKGRKPVPTVLKLLRGNPGRRPISKEEPTPPPSAPECPPQVTGEALAEWERIVPQLLSAGLLTQLDRAALVGYVIAWGQWIEALDQLRVHGTLVKSPNGYPMPSPFLAIANRAQDQWSRLMTEFGLSPSARPRVQRSAPARTESKLEKYRDHG